MSELNCTNCGQTLDDASRFCKFCGAQLAEEIEDAGAVAVKIGDVFEGKWRIEKKLGAGGMGSVWLAHDLSLERKVAIKILAGHLTGDAEFVTRFEREAKLTASLEHPNVVGVFAVGRHRGCPFIVMKALEGQTLGRFLRQHPKGLKKEELLPILKQLCDGLGLIHSKGFVHRDIKAGNIFIGPDGHCTILDLGILRDTKAKEALTRAGTMMGTPHYMSPEQALGKTVDHRADLYAMGVLLYELVAGTAPYNGDNEIKIIEMHLKAPIPDPCALVPALPKAVGMAVMKALGKKREERFQSAAEMYQAVEQAYASAAKRPSRPSRPAMQAMVEEEVDEDSGQPTQAIPKRRTSPPGTPVRQKTPVRAAVPKTPIRAAAVSQKTPVRAQAVVEPAAQPAPAPAKAAGFEKRFLGILGGLALAALAAVGFELYQRSEPPPGPAQPSAEMQPLKKPEPPPWARQATPPPAPEPAAEPAKPAQEAAADEKPAEKPAAPKDEAAKDEKPAEAAKDDAKAKKDKKVASAVPAKAKAAAPVGNGTLRVITMLNGEPFWANVTVDGERGGETPYTVELPAGKHKLEIRRDGYKTINREVELPVGGVTPVRITLEPAG